jgi:hypothetical protein
MRLGFVLASMCVLALAVPALADRGARKTDLFWRSPGLDSLDVRSIALLPVATYDGSAEARSLTEGAVGQAFHGSGHRWTSTLITRDQLRRAGGDSVLKALNEQLLKHGRLDSLGAPAYSQWTRTRALLTVRVDRFERLQLEFNQDGTPTTTVRLTAALVDSTGRLLWTASGSETAEGPRQDASTNPIGVKASGLNNQPMTNQGGAPSYQETLHKLLARWADEFPRRASAAPTAN